MKSALTLIDPYFRENDIADQSKTKDGFTLIELLVVIAIIAILAVVVVLTLNPGQLILQSRDSTRLSDLASLQSAISLYQTDAAINGSVSLGSSSVVYVSIPDPTATSTAGNQCQGLGLLVLPTGYTYHCAATSTFRNVNGTGWIPINFTSMSQNSPLGQLPIDPINQSSTRGYHTYTTNGTQFELTTALESSKYKLGGSNDVVGNDGGTLATVFERGSMLGLQPLDYGDTSLVGLWTFDEGSSSIAYDYSGANATGSWQGTQVGTNGFYSAGKIGTWAGAFDGTSTYINAGNRASFSFGANDMTFSTWVKLSSVVGYRGIVFKGNTGAGVQRGIGLGMHNATVIVQYTGDVEVNFISTISLATSVWYNLVLTREGSNLKLYINGNLNRTVAAPAGSPDSAVALMIGQWGTNAQFDSGLTDNVRVYNRALSASEIQAMYNGGK